MEAYFTIAGVLFTAIIGFFGVKLTAKGSSKAAAESVGVAALTAALNSWMQKAERTDAELQVVKTDLKETKTHYDAELATLKRLLSASREYVGLLLAAWRMHMPTTPPPDPPAGYSPND